MPSTYNGIGTHYYGKKNVQKRAAPCPHCGRGVELTSYDTRLWFVVFFIPIVPLGRKRIVDYCPVCTRHYAVEADKWETSKQLEVSGAQDKFRSSQLPEDAMALHQQLMTYHQLDEAAEFRKSMREKFPDNAKVHAYLGASLEHFGKLDEAAAMFRRALELRPDLPEARTGVAMAQIRAGQLDEAHKLLDYLEKPGAAQLYVLEPLNKLAQAFQQVNRHDDALKLFAVLQRELPHLAEKKWFRNLVKKSEKSVNRTESQLPRQTFSWKRLFQGDGGSTAAGAPQLTWKSLLIVGIIVAVVLLGFVISNEYSKRHRTLHIVNGYSQPVSVRINGVNSVVAVGSATGVTLPEGHYRASISGPVTEDVDLDIRTSYLDRWFSHPAWVLNPGAKAIVIRTEAVYSRDEIPARITIHFGKAFEAFGEVTHPFRELPATVSIKSGETRTLVSLAVHEGKGIDIAAYYAEKGDVPSALNFAESWLAGNPDDDQMLQIYAVQSLQQHQTNRLDKFLRTGMTNRPVRTEWHREYQQLHNNPAGHIALVSAYQALLANEPTNSALLYLCGRLETDRTVARDYFERSQRADLSNPYPVFALGYDRVSLADWEGARKHLEQAVKLRPSNPLYELLLMTTRLALGEFTDVEKEARTKLSLEPANYAANLRLVDVYVREDRRADALEACKKFAAACPAKYGRQAASIALTLRCEALYDLGDFAELEKVAGKTGTFRFQSLVEQGRMDEAIKSQPTQEEEQEKPLTSLALSLAFRLAGDMEHSAHWVEQARTSFTHGNEDYCAAAALLSLDSKELSLDKVNNVVLPCQLKAALVAQLAQLDSPARAELASLARRLNVERTFPHHLIQRATEPVK